MARSTEPLVAPATGEKQTIQARHGVATFVPKGHTIKIINTYGRQVVDTWAFSLGSPPRAEDIEEDLESSQELEEEQEDEAEKGKGEAKDNAEEKKVDEKDAVVGQGVKDEAKGTGSEKEDSAKSEGNGTGSWHHVSESEKTGEGNESDVTEKDTAQPVENTEPETKIAAESGPKDEITAKDKQQKDEEEESKAEVAEEKSDTKASGEGTESSSGKGKETTKGWAAYIPSVRGKKKADSNQLADVPEQAEDASDKKTKKGWISYVPSIRGSKPTDDKDESSKEGTWSQYLSAGKGFSSYLPSNVSLSSFAAAHQRDPSKSLAEQLYEFSKTPVGAAGISVATGSGYASSIFAAYSAYNTHVASRSGADYGMEFLSIPHSRAATGHVSPQVGDVLVSNLRAPLLAVVEDTSPGVHDTLIAACDPQRYKELGVQEWASHGSCAENLVLALQELNKRVGLKGQRAIGADVTVNNVPAPLNLFMNVPVSDSGEIRLEAPASKRGDYITFRAERDLVVVMSACPQDILPINGGRPMVAHFVVESTSEEEQEAQREREEEIKRVLEKARARTDRDKAAMPKKPVLKRGRSSGITSGKTALRSGNSTPKPPSIQRARSSQTSVQSSTSRASRPAPRKLASGSQASLRRQTSGQIPTASTPQRQQPSLVRNQSSPQEQRFTAPTKESQRIKSPVSKPKPPSTISRPSESRSQAPGRGASETPAGEASTSNVRNTPTPGRAKPRKLERRSRA